MNIFEWWKIIKHGKHWLMHIHKWLSDLSAGINLQCRHINSLILFNAKQGRPGYLALEIPKCVPTAQSEYGWTSSMLSSSTGFFPTVILATASAFIYVNNKSVVIRCGICYHRHFPTIRKFPISMMLFLTGVRWNSHLCSLCILKWWHPVQP